MLHGLGQRGLRNDLCVAGGCFKWVPFCTQGHLVIRSDAASWLRPDPLCNAGRYLQGGGREGIEGV